MTDIESLPKVSDEIYRRMRNYGGRDPLTPRMVEDTVFSEYGSEEWKLEEFEKLIAKAVSEIPEESRSTAMVKLGGDECSYLRISYQRLETPEEVAEYFVRAQAYAMQGVKSERAQYERLKAKFEA